MKLYSNDRRNALKARAYEGYSTFLCFFFLNFLFFLTSSSAWATYDRPIRIVGSGTVFVFSTFVAEAFSRQQGFRTPIVESTGTGVGIHLFCAGVKPNTPDVVNASRAMTAGERDMCARSGVTPIPMTIGYDGIVVAQSETYGSFSHLSCQNIFLALSKYRLSSQKNKLVENTVRTWHEVDVTLPKLPIVFYGPSSVSGTRDVFVDLCMRRGALASSELAKLRHNHPALFQKIISTTREDGAYVDVGDNYNLILEKLHNNAHTLGIVGYDYYIMNKGVVRPIVIDGYLPNEKTIQDASYPLARPLLVYIKKEHLGKTPGLAQYATFFLSDNITGNQGLLKGLGLVPMLSPERDKQHVNLSHILQGYF